MVFLRKRRELARIGWMGICLVLGCVACTAGTPPAAVDPPGLTVTPLKDDIEVVQDVHTDAGGTSTAVIDIHSQSGIGQVEIAAPEAGWPDVVELRLHLAGLENLTLDNGTMQIGAAVTTGGHSLQSKTMPDTPETPITPEDPAWITITIATADGSEPAVPLANGTISARLPAVLYGGDVRSVTASWIDFYR